MDNELAPALNSTHENSIWSSTSSNTGVRARSPVTQLVYGNGHPPHCTCALCHTVAIEHASLAIVRELAPKDDSRTAKLPLPNR